MATKKTSPRRIRGVARRRLPRRYILVADHGTARILLASQPDAESGGARRSAIVLEEIARLENPAAHLPSRALVSDRPGRIYESGGRGGSGPVTRTRHGARGDFDPHGKAAERFAKQVVRQLEGERRRGRVEELVVIAEPKFLGTLRPLLPAGLRGLVTREIASDLVRAGDPLIRRALRA